MADLDPSWEEALVVQDDAGQHGLDLNDRQSLLIPTSTYAEACAVMPKRQVTQGSRGAYVRFRLIAVHESLTCAGVSHDRTCFLGSDASSPSLRGGMFLHLIITVKGIKEEPGSSLG